MKNAYGTLALDLPTALLVMPILISKMPQQNFLPTTIHSDLQAKMLAYIDPNHLSFLETDAFDFLLFKIQP